MRSECRRREERCRLRPLGNYPDSSHNQQRTELRSCPTGDKPRMKLI